ncbi:unnamed protein product [Rotaria sp. Silwood2]|nr:unnamed protein product [Rotaria sp. Silwood2]
MQCDVANIVYPRWAYQWVNIKPTFSNFYSTKAGRIRNMLELLGLRFEGHLHSGLDDATNIGRIAIELIKDGCVLAPNEFYQSSVETHGEHQRPPTMRSQSLKMISPNCSRSHSSNQRSCVPYAIQQRGKKTYTERKQQPGSWHSRFPCNQVATSINIPSLLDFSAAHISNPLSERRTRSSQLHREKNNMGLNGIF